MPSTLAMIHTVASLAAPFGELAREMLPGVRVFHVADEGLLARIIREETITPAMCLRVVELASHAEADGADVVLLTCSAMSPAVNLAAPLVQVPIHKVDQAMVDRALALGRRIAVFSTVPATLESVGGLVRSTAAAKGCEIEVTTDLNSSAMAALRSGRRKEHDELVRESLANLAERADVVLVAQASAAQALRPEDKEVLTARLLTSPRLGMERLRDAYTWGSREE